jgi:hypothetical protein
MTAHVPPPTLEPNGLAQARKFLTRVIAWPQQGHAPAYANIHWTFRPKDSSTIRRDRDGKEHLPWYGRAVGSVDDAIGTVAFATKSTDIKDIYVCLATMMTTEQKVTRAGYTYNKPIRDQDNVVAIKSLWLDLDAKGADKNSYDDLSEAQIALSDFLKKNGMPRPTIIVRSGGGLHVYWTLSRALTRREWQPLANALAEATKKYGLKCDTQCTVDSARVLRVPGTQNYKTDPPRPVRIAVTVLETDYGNSVIEKALEPYRVTTTFGDIAFKEPGPLSSLFAAVPLKDVDQLGAGINKPEYDPVHLDELAAECAFVREAIVTGGAAYSNPMWNLTTLIATFTDDQRNDAHRMGNRHPGYSQADTDAFFDRKLR